MATKMDCKCGQPAEYTSPAPLCRLCWVKWWSSSQPGDKVQLTPEEQQAYYNETLAELMKDDEEKDGGTAEV